MASKKVYYNENDEQNQTEVMAYENDADDLFVCLTDTKTRMEMFATIPRADAIALISELAWSFDLIEDQSLDSGNYFWKGRTNAY